MGTPVHFTDYNAALTYLKSLPNADLVAIANKSQEVVINMANIKKETELKLKGLEVESNQNNGADVKEPVNENAASNSGAQKGPDLTHNSKSEQILLGNTETADDKATNKKIKKSAKLFESKKDQDVFKAQYTERLAELKADTKLKASEEQLVAYAILQALNDARQQRVQRRVYFTDKAAFDAACKANPDKKDDFVLFSDDDIKIIENLTPDGKSIYQKNEDGSYKLNDNGTKMLNQDAVKNIMFGYVGDNYVLDITKRGDERRAAAIASGKDGVEDYESTDPLTKRASVKAGNQVADLFVRAGFDATTDKSLWRGRLPIIGSLIGLSSDALAHGLGAYNQEGTAHFEGDDATYSGTVSHEADVDYSGNDGHYAGVTSFIDYDGINHPVPYEGNNATYSGTVHYKTDVDYSGNDGHYEGDVDYETKPGIGHAIKDSLGSAGFGFAVGSALAKLLENDAEDVLPQTSFEMSINKPKNFKENVRPLASALFAHQQEKGISNQQLGQAGREARGEAANSNMPSDEFVGLYFRLKSMNPEEDPNKRIKELEDIVNEQNNVIEDLNVALDDCATKNGSNPVGDDSTDCTPEITDLARTIPVNLVPRRTGHWFLAHAYGDNLSPAEINAIKRYLDTNGAGYEKDGTKRTGNYVLPTIVTITVNGQTKTYELPENNDTIRQRVMIDGNKKGKDHNRTGKARASVRDCSGTETTYDSRKEAEEAVRKKQK
jgi:hypothetical protein